MYLIFHWTHGNLAYNVFPPDFIEKDQLFMSLVPVSNSQPQWYDIAGLIRMFFAVRAERKAQAEALEAYKVEWIRLLSKEEVVTIFERFTEFFALTLASRSPYPSTAGSNMRNIRDTLLEVCKYTVKNKHRVDDTATRKLYDIFNTDFVKVKDSFLGSDMTSTFVVTEWFDKTMGLLTPLVDVRLPHPKMASDLVLEITAPEPANYKQQLKSSTLPEEIIKRILQIDKEVTIKLSWSLDFSTRHSLASIVSSSLPEMVKAYTNVSATNDSKSAEKVVTSILKQLTILEKFITSIEQRFISESVHSMNVQEKFLESKFITQLD